MTMTRPGSCTPGAEAEERDGVHPAAREGAVDGSAAAKRRVPRRLPVEIASSLLGGRWAVPILWRLFWGGRRFHQLRRSIGAISQDSLSTALAEMERRGVVGRRFSSFSITESEFQLTELGRSLRPVLGAMHEWGLYVMSLPGEQQRAIEDTEALEAGHTGIADAEGPLRVHATAVGADV
jgi:DNA-binding HxlR family transcriptional regulator